MKKYRKIISLGIVALFILLVGIWNNNDFYDLMRWTLRSAVPLMMIALAGLFSERSGVVNIALEGIAIFGAFTGLLLLAVLQHNGINGQWILLLCVIAGGVAGALFSLLHSFASISMKANQTISGTALNMLAVALAIFLGRALSYGGTEEIQFADPFLVENLGFVSKIPIIGDIFFKGFYPIVLFGILIYIIGSIFAYKTRFGLRMRACGENPQAADAAGVNVYKIRYISVTISGFIAGAAGVILIVPTSTSFRASVYGFGFLAMAVLISGQWNPARIIIFSLFFALLRTMSKGKEVMVKIFSDFSQQTTFLSNVNAGISKFIAKIPNGIIEMLPYVFTLVVLALTSKNSQGPRAAGEPYDQGKR